jgi:two-component system cell cycle sensor histidine kinase/response regulator CckA
LSLHVLLVDDDDPILQVLTSCLSFSGYRVTAARDGVEAWELFSASPDDFDVIVSDLKMPGMDGRQLIELIRSEGHTTPVMVMSGTFSTERMQQHLSRLNVMASLTKPFSVLVLEKHLEHLEHHQII